MKIVKEVTLEVLAEVQEAEKTLYDYDREHNKGYSYNLNGNLKPVIIAEILRRMGTKSDE